VRSSPRRARPVVVGSLLSGLFFVTLAVLLFRAEPLLINVQPIYTIVSAIVIGIMGLAVGWSAASANWRNAPLLIALAALVTLPAVQYGALSSGGDDTVQQMARLVQQQHAGHEQVGTWGVFVRNLVFYAGLKTTDVIDDQQAKEFLMQTDRALLVAPASEIDRLEREQGVRVTRIAELLYFNEAGIRVRTLLWPDAERDLMRVVLVSNR
jgi:hypothetical protein